MFARKLALVAVLLVATPAFAAFHSDVYMLGEVPGTGALANGATVDQGSTIRLTVWDTQTWDLAPPHADNRMTWVQLNFQASTAGLHDELLAGSWTWEYLLGLLMTLDVDDSLTTTWDSANIPTPDYMVMRTSTGTWPATDAVPDLELGTLEFTAPAYDPGGSNTYTVSLAGGWDDPGLKRGTMTQFVGKLDESSGPLWAGTSTLGDFTFTVTPEPATLALMAMGSGLALFIRRKR